MGLRKNVAHAAQVAFSFFADIADEKYGGGEGHFGCVERGRDREQGCRPGSVIGNSGPIETVALLTQVERSSGGKNRIDVSAECRILPGCGRFNRLPGVVNAENVAQICGQSVPWISPLCWFVTVPPTKR